MAANLMKQLQGQAVSTLLSPLQHITLPITSIVLFLKNFLNSWHEYSMKLISQYTSTATLWYV
jgi:hypothetical protein